MMQTGDPSQIDEIRIQHHKLSLHSSWGHEGCTGELGLQDNATLQRKRQNQATILKMKWDAVEG